MHLPRSFRKDSLKPWWAGPHTVVLTTPTALSVLGVTEWVHCSEVKKALTRWMNHTSGKLNQLLQTCSVSTFDETPPTDGHLFTVVPGYCQHDINTLTSGVGLYIAPPSDRTFSQKLVIVIAYWAALGNL